MPSYKLKLYKGKIHKDGTHPIVLQIIHNRKTKRVSIGLNAKPDEWIEEISRFSKNKRSFRNQNKVLEHFESRAEKTIRTITLEEKQFSFSLFIAYFFKQSEHIGVIEFLEKHVEKLGIEKKYSTQSSYKSTLNVLRKHTRNKEISFYSLNYEFLIDFESYLFQRNCTNGGINHHMRNIRAIFNEAIRKGCCEASYYPFTNTHNANGYSLKRVTSKAKPRALNKEDLEKLKNFDIEAYPNLENAYKYFFFSYYARGINFTDMAHLTKSDIQGGRISFNRKKTGTHYSFKITKRIAEILEFFDTDNSPYLFPILSDYHQTEKQKKYRIHKCLKKTNKELRKIGVIINSSIPITSYVARHTWASTLKHKGYSTEIISEGLGHSELSTTKAYLENFNQELIDQTDKAL